MKLIQIFRQGNRDHFYLTHLSYGTLNDEDRRNRWEYAVKNNLIGLDLPEQVNRSWESFPEDLKRQLSTTWRYQFNSFYGMKYGDFVVVAAGTTHLLGIGVVAGPCRFKPQLRRIFFQHIRDVHWQVKWKWQERFALGLPGFQNTIKRVDQRSQHWQITDIELTSPEEADLSFLTGATSEDDVLKRIAPLSGIERDRLVEELDKKVGAPESASAVVKKIRRDQILPALMKAKHRFKCQLCGFTFRKRNGQFYAEVAHIEPLKNGGLDISSNLLVLCPNHHKMFDEGDTKVISRTPESIVLTINGVQFEASFRS